MRTMRWMSATALAGATCIAFAAPAFAQEATPPAESPAGTLGVDQATDDQASEPESITVTGSRIRRPDFDSAIPVTAISGDELFQRGQSNVGDALNDLPQLRSTVAQQNPGLGIGVAGLNLLDLRGLGTQRTLVLVNGRRHVASDILSNAVSVDINTIPNELIERVDIATGANSAVYGSDAIAGVVNFILKKDFDGVQLRAGAGTTEEGWGGNQFVSLLAGHNFAGGRANVTVHGEYVRQDRVFGSDVSFIRQNNALSVTDTDPAGLVNGSDGIPDRTFIRDLRSASIHRFGLVPITQPNPGALCGIGIQNGSAAGLPYNCTYIFNPNGSLVQQTGSRIGTGLIGGIVGGNGQTGREENQLSVLPFMERANFNLLARFEISPAAELFLEAKYAHIETSGSNSGPAFVQGQTFGDARERTRLDNPFLDAAARTTIANAILASGFRPSLSARTALTAADRAAIADGSFRFVTSRNLLDLGLRDEYAIRDTYRVVGGIRGTFNTDWSYELSVNYGRTEDNTTVLGNIDLQRFLLAMDAGRNPATGAIECRAKFDPAARVDYIGTDASAARFDADIAACVPYNPFGQADNSAARGYIVTDTVSRGRLEQFVVNGFVSGDSSQLFELPGGPIGFAIGGEYRRENAFFQADPLVEQGFTFLNALQTFDPDPFEVKELFGEVRLPLLRNVPFFEELSISGAGRLADYNGPTGTVFAWNAGAEWSPVRGLRFRGGFGRSIRAPNYTETGQPLGQNFAPGFQDPCRPSNIGSGTQFRAANCAADLGALLNNADFAALPVYSLEILSGSNPALTEESADQLTLGAIFEPRFLPGFAASVDYFDINVKNVIVSPSAQAIVNSCYDLPDLNNQFCALVQRYRGAGTGPNDEVPGQILQLTLEQTPLNFASRRRRGVDVNVSYNKELGGDASIFTRVLYTHTLENSNFEDPTRPDFENRLLRELGNPQDEFVWNVDLTLGALTIGYRMNFIGPMLTSSYEDQFALQDRPPQNADFADILEYPTTVYHDLRFNYQIGEGKQSSDFFLGVDNIADTPPPLGLTGTGADAAIYRVRGRNFYAGIRARF